MITVFTTAKHFVGSIKTAQMNALTSWKQIHPEVEIILFGRTEGAEEIARQLGLVYIPEVATNEMGTPLISAMFETAQRCGRHDLQMYVNCDIILLDDALPTLRSISWPRFLVVGQRWDLDVNEAIDFCPGWIARLRQYIWERGALHAPNGSDYFVFPRGLFQSIPPLAVGRIGWDNWMIGHCLSEKIPVIDASQSITVVHQNHASYTHTRRVGDKVIGLESERNLQMTPYAAHIFLTHANWFISSQGLRPKRSLRYRMTRLFILPILQPERYGWLRWPARFSGFILYFLDSRLSGRTWLRDDVVRLSS